MQRPNLPKAAGLLTAPSLATAFALSFAAPAGAQLTPCDDGPTCGGCASMTTPIETEIRPMEVPPWAGQPKVLEFDPFDPSLGELVRVDIRVVAEADVVYNIENRDVSGPCLSPVIEIGSDMQVTLDDLAMSVLTLQPISVEHVFDDLTAYDGTLDFTGPSGDNFQTTKPFPASICIDDPVMLAEFIDQGPGDRVTFSGVVSTPVQQQGSGCGQLTVDFSFMVGLEIKVQYTYCPNERPNLEDDSAETCEGVPVGIDVLANDMDPDGSIDCSSIEILSGPANGMAMPGIGCTGTTPCPGCVVNYTPDPGFTGLDTFTYRVMDDEMCFSEPATVMVTVLEAPIAVDDDGFSCQGDPVVLDVLANDGDPDGTLDCGSISITTPPAGGTIQIGAQCGGPEPCNGCVITYTPNMSFSGSDSFGYTVADTDGCISNEATVSIMVDANPVAVDDNVSLCEGGSIGIDVLGNDGDPDGSLDCGTVEIVSVPSSGNAVIGPGCNGLEPCASCQITYTPNGMFFGTDTFTYRVRDEMGCVSNIATVTVDVFPMPEANNDTRVICEDEPIDIVVLSNDFVPGQGFMGIDCSTVVVTDPPDNGTAVVLPACAGSGPCPGCAIRYTPDPGFSGLDSFAYTFASLEGCLSNEATVTLEVGAAPIAQNDAASTCQGDPVVIDLLQNDGDPDGQLDCGSITITSGPSNGTAMLSAGCTGLEPCNGCEVLYTPGGAFTGTDQFTYSIADETGCFSNEATVTVSVGATPVAMDDSVSLCEGEVVGIDVLGNDDDPDGSIDCGTIEIVSGPSSGNAVIGAGCTGLEPCAACEIEYTPAPGFFGRDGFTYRVLDETGCVSNVATVTIAVSPMPVANDDADSTCEGEFVDVVVLGNDIVPGQSLMGIDCGSIVITDPPDNGTANILPECSGPGPCAGCAIRYTPDQGYSGPDSFAYTFSSVEGCLSNEAMVNMTVRSAPVTQDDAVATCQGDPVAIDVLANDDDSDGSIDCGTITIISGPSNGTVVSSAGCTGIEPCNDCELVYTPGGAFLGTDQFTYTVTDETGCVSDETMVTIDVTPVPVTNDDDEEICQGETVVIDVLGNDSGPLDPSTVQVVSQPMGGAILNIDPLSGAITYRSDDVFCGGADVFAYRVDSLNECPSAPADVSVTVRCGPVAQDDSVVLDPSSLGPVDIDVLDNDFDPDGPIDCGSLTIVTPPSHGSVVIDGSCVGDEPCVDCVVTYTPGPTFDDFDTFTYRIVDEDGCFDTAQVVVQFEFTCVEQTHRRRPGSLLLFPEFDSREGVVTLATVTNTRVGGNAGDVALEYVYRREGDCLEFNRTELLTPGDTLSVIVGVHVPDLVRGFLYVVARCPDSGEAIAYNGLIGQYTVFDGIDAFSYSTNTVSFEGIGGQPDPQCSQYALTDVDGDGIHDLDGIEYTRAPDQIVVPRYFGQSQQGVTSELVLLGLSGGAAFTTQIDLMIFNDNEEIFLRTYSFDCWAKVPLTEIAGVFTNDFLQTQTNHDALEILGAPGREAGWMLIDGAIAESTERTIIDPAVYAVLVECVGGSRCVADLPFELCDQSNGDLFPVDPGGDPND